MWRLAFGSVLLLLAACEEPATTTTNSASSSRPSGEGPVSASAPTAVLAPQVDIALRERARVVVKGCTWSDDNGFSECKELDALLLPKLSPVQAFATAEHMLADTDPRMRHVAWRILGYTLSNARPPVPPPSAAVAVVKAAYQESVPALDLRLAMTAASLPKSDALREPLAELVRSASVAKRATALVFLSNGEADPPWVGELLREAAKDKDAEVRLAATRGLSSRFVSHRSETCKALVEALGDADVRVRDAARAELVGNIDIMIDDDKRGLIGGRAAPFAKPCDEADVAAAYASLEKDVRDRKVSPDARALFHNGALLHMPVTSGEPAGDQPKKRRDLAVKELTAIAKEVKAPRSARLTAIRGLRLKIAGDTKQTLAELAKDADELVAKAASAPVAP